MQINNLKKKLHFVFMELAIYGKIGIIIFMMLSYEYFMLKVASTNHSTFYIYSFLKLHNV